MWDLMFAIAGYLILSTEITALFLLAVVVYRLGFHPLARVQGPRLAAVSSIWQGVYVRNGRARQLGKTLHQKYGPVVRVGPNEVWLNSEEGFKTVYGMLQGARFPVFPVLDTS